ncbi:MAG: response regulator [Alphaproteobacteria bacterium]|nr:response regulator [Alphaproteobacteria bacterium]
MTTRNILIIDDSQTILKVVSEMLKNNGFRVSTASNGKEGLEKALNEHIDAIILDKIMPEMDGNEVLEKLKNNPATKKIPVMMLTALSNIMEISKSLEMGAYDYIVKPFDNDNLLVRLNNIINKAEK